MPKTLRLAVSQSRTLPTLSATLSALSRTTTAAAAQGVDLVLFPEAYLGGYPRTCTFGASVGARTAHGRDQFLAYFRAAVDLGDVPDSAHFAAWRDKRLPTVPPAEGEDAAVRGDGTREELERIARESGVFVVTGVVERAGGSLYCAVVYVDPRLGMVGKRRKVMPTGAERLVWAQGSPSTLRAVVAHIKGVRVVMGAAVCWENYMPLLRQSLYAQDVNLWLAPTADARDTWLSLMRTVAGEGRCFVLSANMCVRKRDLPEWISEGGQGKRKERRESAGRQDFEPRARRKSLVVKEDDHELVLPIFDEQEEEDVSPVSLRSRDGRRASLVLEEAGHELVLPKPEENTAYPIQEGPRHRRRSSVVVKEEGHELVLPAIEEQWQHHKTNGMDYAAPALNNSEDGDGFVCRGGSCIVGPMGDVLAEPLWEVDEGGLLVVDADFEDCERGRLDLDVAGSYSRNDAFRLTVEGLDLNPPP